MSVKMITVELLENKGIEQIDIGTRMEAIKLPEGYKIFHYSGWWLVPFEYCREV